MPTPRFTLIRRKLRHRFGITAPQVSVRTAQPWYWRLVALTVVLAVSMALAQWIYDAGMKIAGYDRAETGRVIGDLRRELAELKTENDSLLRAVRSSESSIQVELATQEGLTQQIKALQVENAYLKEDVSLFEGFVSGASIQAAGPRVVRVTLEPVGSNGRFKYRILLVNRSTVRGGAEFRGDLQFDLVTEQAGKDASMRIPSEGMDAERFRVTLRHFHRVEGEFQLPAGATLKGGEVRLLRDGVVHARQSIVL